MYSDVCFSDWVTGRMEHTKIFIAMTGWSSSLLFGLAVSVEHTADSLA
jgi:hypothetical protein